MHSFVTIISPSFFYALVFISHDHYYLSDTKKEPVSAPKTFEICTYMFSECYVKVWFILFNKNMELHKIYLSSIYISK